MCNLSKLWRWWLVESQLPSVHNLQFDVVLNFAHAESMVDPSLCLMAIFVWKNLIAIGLPDLNTIAISTLTFFYMLLFSFLNHLFSALIKGAFCAMRGFSDREENCFDFRFSHYSVIRCDTFSLQKRKKKWTIFFNREDFYFLWEG